MKTLFFAMALFCALLAPAQTVCGDVSVPKSFSPNGDGINDVFMVVGNCLQSVHLEVTNRWGELIFESNELTNPWRGVCNDKPCDSGVFYFSYTVKLTTGEELKGNGNVFLER